MISKEYLKVYEDLISDKDEISNEKIKVMVDLSATLIHHGHVRLLKKLKNMEK